MSTPELKKHPKGAYLLLTTVMWEFFSYYGMRALLILYLSKQLLFSDHKAYGLYGAYTSLVYVTPIIGGYVADKLLGYRFATIIGAIFISAGHFILVIPHEAGLYIGLAMLVVGVGFFKTNSIALLGELYTDDIAHRSSAYSLYYVGGNIGGFLSPILCAYVAKYYGWHWGFILAGIGMFCGLMIMLCSYHHFKEIGNPKLPDNRKKLIKTTFPFCFLILVALCAFFLVEQIVGYILICIVVVGIIYQIKVHLRCEKAVKKELYLFYTLTVISTMFWIFDQQGGSSISLFISRNVDRWLAIGSFKTQLPTALFQVVNPATIIILGPFVAFIWKALASRAITVTNLFKFLIGITCLTVGFFFIALDARLAIATGQTTMWYVVLGLGIVALAELFIDPVVLAFVTKIAPENTVSVMTGMYYLFCGAVANFLSAEVAKLTAVPQSVKSVTLSDYAIKYYETYTHIFYVGLILFVITLICMLIFRRLAVK